MTVLEVLEQAKTLSPRERQELAKLLIDTLEVEAVTTATTEGPTNAEPWGTRLVQLLQQVEVADWGNPNLENPVEALQALRHQEHAQLEGYWSDDK